MADIVYCYNNEVYFNLTNKCPCNCTFCIRNNGDSVGEAKNLWFEKEPTMEEIAKEIGIEKEMIVYALDAIQSPVSLYEPVYSEGGDTLYVMDQISDRKNKEEHWLENLSLKEAMNRLGSRERHIIEMRFYEGKTQMEVADEIGISQAQVSRLEKNALKTMRNYLRP